MGAARGVVGAGLAVVLASSLLVGCRTGDDDTVAVEPDPSPTATLEAPDPGPTRSAPPAVSPAPTEPTAPAPTPAVNGTTSVTAPLAGATVPGPTVTVTGEGTALEGTLLWRVVRAGSADTVAEGWTQAGANGDVGPYAFDVMLEPGDYVAQVWEPDMREGDEDGGRRNLVEVAFTVS